jgi:hypothetical protein
MTAHTPGPWEAYIDGQISSVNTFAESDRAMLIDITRSGTSVKQDNANARLIAAAPDLLAALERLYAALSLDADMVLACEQARAALAKAKGGV